MKYYKINPQILFRHYGDFGYLTDNRNFGYNFLNEEFVLGDEIISETGADIVSCLKKEPLSINDILNSVYRIFGYENGLEHDVIEFLELLCSKGFIISGSTEEECANGRFEFKVLTNESRNQEKGNSPIETQTFLSKRFGDNPFPTSIHVEIASECNERCVHCYIPHEFKSDLIDDGLFLEILHQARKMNLLHITISGGEPMLHPHFIDFLRECRINDMSVNVLSNLTLLNDEMVAEMKLNPLLSVQTSVYSMIPDIHDGITHKKNSLNRTLSSIVKLIENRIPVQISCPILKVNHDSYKDVQRWAVDHNISVGIDFSIIARYNHNQENLGCRLSYEELEHIISEKIINDSEYIEDLKKEITENKRKTEDSYICSICNSSICIGPSGNVFPCVGWTNKVVGNIVNNSLYDIWIQSDEVKRLRTIRLKDFIECKGCNFKEYCTICMVRNSNESPTGNPFELSRYFCNIAKIKKELHNKNCSNLKRK